MKSVDNPPCNELQVIYTVETILWQICGMLFMNMFIKKCVGAGFEGTVKGLSKTSRCQKGEFRTNVGTKARS